MSDAPFDLGVLFVHGIGNQPERSTLEEGGGLAHTLRRWLGAEDVREVELSQAPGDPASGRVAVDVGGRSLNVLVAEGWWASAVPAPGAWRLLMWLFQVVPLVVPRVLDAGLRRSSVRMDKADWWRPLFFGSALARLVQNVFTVAATLGFLLALFVLWALALPRTAIDKLRRAEPSAGDGPVLVPVLAGTALGAGVLLALPGTTTKQGVVAVVVMLVLITGWTLPRLLNTTLANFIGDCHALLRLPPVERAMVERVESSLGWLESAVGGAPVVVVAHSQGAEIARRVLEERSTPVRGLVTYGSGIAKLDAVDRLRRSPWRSGVALLLRFVSAVLVVAAAALVWSDPGSLSTLALALVLLLVAPAPMARARALLRSVVGERFTADRLGVGPEKVGRWADFQTANDPVSEGALPLEEPWGSSTEIVNGRVLLLDHIRYWRNVEGFRAPLILELAAVVGCGQPASVPAAVRVAAAARARRVGQRVWLRVAFLAVAIAGFVFAGGVAQWLVAGVAAVAAGVVEWRLIAREVATSQAWSPCARSRSGG